jgi:hypothetical protein
MERYTYDVESTMLTNDEHRAFAYAVQTLCYLTTQHNISMALAEVKSPCTLTAMDNVQRRARQMWRTAINAE